MARKSYVTSMPDKTGAFLIASKIIAKNNGNIIRVSYNKAVDLHTLFIDVEAAEDSLEEIEKELRTIGYLKNKLAETRVMVVNIKIPDASGAILPVLKILDTYDINISYMNSSSNNSEYQDFKMGLLIENPMIIKLLLEDISEVYQIDIIDYDSSEQNLDNTIFYIRLANEMQKLMSLSTNKTMEFISESNRILQILQVKGESPDKVFDYIRRFAYFISQHKGNGFNADIETLKITDAVTLYSIQPPCGSNTYIFFTEEEALIIDTGYAIYADEMRSILNNQIPGWSRKKKRIYITHADVDHCGLLSMFEGVRIYLNQKSADSLRMQYEGIPDYREINDLNLGYSKLSRIISGYIPANPDRFEIMDEGTPEEHSDLLPIGNFKIADLDFEVLEGSGGHLYGEMVFLCRKYGIAVTGDILVNIRGFSEERAEFNSLAPYLMRSVNVDSEKATKMREDVIKLIEETENQLGRTCIVLGGHGPISELKLGRLINKTN